MARIDWSVPGTKMYEAGVEKGVLYVASEPGVAWTGLINVSTKQSGGEAKLRYLDGVVISNRSSPEEFEGTIEAYTYPQQFERCDGTKLLENGLRATRQRRQSFSMCYRTLVGNDLNGLKHAYKIHILYNLRAEPSDRGYRSLTNEIEPSTFQWNISARPEMVAGIRPSAEFVLDSRDVPADLMSDVEDILYGSPTTAPRLPTAGELVFMFDSYLDMVYDAGGPYTPVFVTYDAGTPVTPVTATIDGGTP